MPSHSYQSELGNPECVFFERRSRLKQLSSGFSLLVGTGLLLLGSLFAFAYAFPSPKEVERIAAVRGTVFGLAVGFLGLGAVGVFFPIRRWRRGEVGFAVYLDKLVSFDARRWRSIRFQDIARIDETSGRRCMTLADGTVINISNRVHEANLLAEIIRAGMPERTSTNGGRSPEGSRSMSNVARRDSASPHKDASFDGLIAAQRRLERGKTMLIGMALLVAVPLLHDAFGRLERGETDSILVWRGFALLYEVFGPTLSVAIIGISGLMFTLHGMKKILWAQDLTAPKSQDQAAKWEGEY